MAKKPKRKKSERSKIIAQCDKLWSRYIRAKYADEEGFAECYTCRKRDHLSRLCAGHFASRRHLQMFEGRPLRYHEQNTRVQCFGCNIGQHGLQWLFGDRLEGEERGLPRSIFKAIQGATATTAELKSTLHELQLLQTTTPDDWWIQQKREDTDSGTA